MGATSKACVVANNVCDSTGNVISIAEQAGGDYNLFTGNMTIGTVVITGAHSAANNNLQFV